ncbi:hypothetical protein [Clostridium paridis]|uniref:Uncharacterized protein n=1 Tax=Clostridium paridis TaxID=2803863 RepID=A0A937FHH3_9CLOT|nr:hypothetical protein [Clostridium paridis]MBL4932372.1 hypothetical protein [Clostridium paridis]
MKNMKYVGLLGVIFGVLLSRFLGNYFGNSSQVMAMFVVVTCALFIIIALFVKKFYLGAIIMLSITLPLIIGAIGMYLDNLYMILGGIVLFFVTLIIAVVIAKRATEK